MRHQLLLLSLLALPLSGCVVAGAAAGVVAGNNLVNNNVYVTNVQADATKAWDTAKKFLAESSLELIEFDDETRVAKAKIDDSRVTVQVEAWDVDQARLTVAAKRFFATVNDGEMAKIITERLVRRIEQ
jgi:stage V sporulation protein SpoVS